jgi:hypothetical protein
VDAPVAPSVRQAPAAARSRPWTRVGTVAAGAHIFYELMAGVGMPLASRMGPRSAGALWATSTVAAYHQAGRQPASRDAVFSVLNGLYLSAVVAHFIAWPRTNKVGLPWLTECEGLAGPVIAPYNAILHVSGLAALGGLVENRRAAPWGVLVPLVTVPWLLGLQHEEFRRLVVQAREHPGWWNRRLSGRGTRPGR